MCLRFNLWLPGYCRIRLIGFKSTKISYRVIMASSRDCDVIPRDQHFLNCSMAHAKRLSTTQYKPHLSTVFRLAYSSFRKCMGNTVSIYLSIRRLASLHHDSYSYQLVLERVNTGQRHLGPSRNMLNNTTTQYKQHSRSRTNFRKSDLPAIVIYNCNKMAIFAILRPLVRHVSEMVETSNFFWYILR